MRPPTPLPPDRKDNFRGQTGTLRSSPQWTNSLLGTLISYNQNQGVIVSLGMPRENPVCQALRRLNGNRVDDEPLGYPVRCKNQRIPVRYGQCSLLHRLYTVPDHTAALDDMSP